MVILLGLIVSAFTVIVGWLYATTFAAKVYIDPNPKLSKADVAAKLEQAPSAMKALTPILIPIVLIVLKSISDFPTKPMGEGHFREWIGFIGETVIALLIGVILAFRLPKNWKETCFLPQAGLARPY